MQQTPVHEGYNPELLGVIPVGAKFLIDVGCGSGALAREFKKINPDCNYVGIEIDESYAKLAERYCDGALVLDIESVTDEFWIRSSNRDCWIFGDSLEHLRDPWRILRNIRAHISTGGVVVACIPNVQHWTMQARISIGDFRYQDSGLLDRTHLRWFTRQTILEMFDACGFSVDTLIPRIFNEEGRAQVLPIIGQMARVVGADPEIAMQDSMPLQYVVRARPRA